MVLHAQAGEGLGQLHAWGVSLHPLAVRETQVLSGSGSAQFHAALDLVEAFSGSALFPAEVEGEAVVFSVFLGLGQGEALDVVQPSFFCLFLTQKVDKIRIYY